MKSRFSNAALLLIVLISLFTLSDCKDETQESVRDRLTKYLVNKTDGWSLNSIHVPINTATTEDDWMNFKLTAGSTTMNTSGHPAGSEAVWPSGSWIMNDEGTIITRADGVVMDIITLTETYFRVSFAVSSGKEIGGRVAALEGEYIFELE